MNAVNAPATPATLVLDGRTLPDRSLVGGKAWSIAHMMSRGLRVPPAFVVTTPSNARYQREGGLWPELVDELVAGVARLEAETGRRFGGTDRPLLVSVRSGAAVSMPGMMDTVLNLGMNEATEAALAAECGDPGFARDTHRRFLQLFGNVVLRADLEEEAAADLASIREQLRLAGHVVPVDPHQQLRAAVEAVFQSWDSRRARRFREHNGIPHDLGTAVTIQAMVFGNLNDRSGTGVLFSRNPLTGERTPYGEFLYRAQGEDVVSGRHTPQPLDALRAQMPAVHAELLRASDALEDAGRDVQDIEFTVEDGRLYILQSRSAKLAPLAAARTSVDFVSEGRITSDVALKRISPERLRQLLAPTLSDKTLEGHTPIAKGEGACPGVGIGVVVTDADEAERRIQRGERVILARPTTSPNDLHGMIGAAAVVTEEGGSTSHAAVVCRSLGVPCVVGCGSDAVLPWVGKTVTVDGQRGELFASALPVDRADEAGDPVLREILGWARSTSPLKVLRPAEVGDVEVVDLSDDAEACDAATIDAAIARLTARQQIQGVKGGAIASDAGVRAAVNHGLAFIVTDPVLPALVAAAISSR